MPQLTGGPTGSDPFTKRALEALLAAAHAAGSWTEVLVEADVAAAGVRPRAAAVVALPGTSGEEAAFALALGRALGLPVVDVDGAGWPALTSTARI